MFGLGVNGFLRKRYQDILDSMNTRAQELFGENVNLTEKSPLGIFFRVISWSISLAWELAEKVYFSAFVSTAEGINLDYVGKYIGAVRREAEEAAGTITITGTAATIVSAGFLVATESGTTFETTAEATIGIGGTIDVEVIALEAGVEGNVQSGTLTTIVNPQVGISSVTNAASFTTGRNIETDVEFRERYALSLAKGGSSTLDSIRASLLTTTGVRAALVVENVTMLDDIDGRPPKSIECYVLGGSSADVAQTILDTKAAGIETYGTEAETVQDLAGNNQVINFSYADEIDIYVNIDITKNAEYPIDGDELVRTEIIKYIGGTDENTNVYNGLTMGEDVIFTQLINKVYQIPGVEDVEVESSMDGVTYDTINISIALFEVAETDFNKVVVTSA